MLAKLQDTQALLKVKDTMLVYCVYARQRAGHITKNVDDRLLDYCQLRLDGSVALDAENLFVLPLHE